MTSYEKLSKKAKRAVDREKRNTWDFNPTTKVVKSKKVYDRNKAKKEVF